MALHALFVGIDLLHLPHQRVELRRDAMALDTLFMHTFGPAACCSTTKTQHSVRSGLVRTVQGCSPDHVVIINCLGLGRTSNELMTRGADARTFPTPRSRWLRLASGSRLFLRAACCRPGHLFLRCDGSQVDCEGTELFVPVRKVIVTFALHRRS